MIAVTAYLLHADVSAGPEDRLTARLDTYARQVAATSASTPVKTTVAGYPAWSQTLERPAGAESLRYDATFVFAGWHLVQVLCQYDGGREQIRSGCRRVLDTLRLNLL